MVVGNFFTSGHEGVGVVGVGIGKQTRNVEKKQGGTRIAFAHRTIDIRIRTTGYR